MPDEAVPPLESEIAAGTMVGEYRIEGKIGEGGFGAVYKAVHPVIGTAAAIKVLGWDFSSNPEMVSRFVAEARAVNQIHHKNIIDVFAVGRMPDGRQYYVMELLSGQSLDEVADLAADLQMGVLTITFTDGTRYVVPRHRAAKQIWGAAELTAWHFDPRADGTWVASKNGDELWSTVERILTNKLVRPVKLR